MAKRTKATPPDHTPAAPGERVAGLTAAWATAFDALVAARVGFLALCDEPSAAGGRRDRAEDSWREAERAESAAAAAALGVWTGGSGDADAVTDESEVEVDPAAALTFWKRADWAGYCGWAATRLPPPPV